MITIGQQERLKCIKWKSQEEGNDEMKKSVQEKRVKETSEKAQKVMARKIAGSKEMWELRLYVAGQGPKSLAAFARLKKICEQHLPEKHKIEIVDLLNNPQLGGEDRIFAIPTVVRKLPLPMKKITGDLSNRDRVISCLDIAAIEIQRNRSHLARPADFHLLSGMHPCQSANGFADEEIQ